MGPSAVHLTLSSKAGTISLTKFCLLSITLGCRPITRWNDILLIEQARRILKTNTYSIVLVEFLAHFPLQKLLVTCSRRPTSRCTAITEPSTAIFCCLSVTSSLLSKICRNVNKQPLTHLAIASTPCSSKQT